MKIILNSKFGVIVSPVNGVMMDIIRNIPGRKRWTDGKFHFEPTRENIDYLNKNIIDIDWVDSDDRLKYLDELAKIERNTINIKNDLGIQVTDYQFETKPYAHQEKAFLLGRDLESFAYFMEMGTGKTKVTIDNAAWLYLQDKIDAVLVIAPKGVHRKWISQEINLHWPKYIKHKASFWSAGLSTKEKDLLKETLNYNEGCKILSTNIDSLNTERGARLIENYLSSNRCLFVIDESTRIKSQRARCTKKAIKFGKLAKYRRILSGAPVTQGIEDLYTQLKFLDEDILGFSSYYSFRAHYCITGGWQNKSIVGYKNVEELQKKIEPYSFRVIKSECLTLPEKVYVTRTVELTSEQRILYNKIKNEALVELSNDTELDVSRAITKLLRLQQIICGHLPNEIDKTWSPIDNNRLSTCLDIINECLGKVVVWCRFTADINQLISLFEKNNIKYVRYDGYVNDNLRHDNLNNFQNNEDIKVFIGNPKAGGIGLDLTSANNMIYYSNDFNAETRWQSEDRCHRIGQINHVTYIDLIAEKTIDDKIIDALKKKKNIADTVFSEGLAKLLED